MRIFKRICGFLISLSLIGSFTLSTSKAFWHLLKSDFNRQAVVPNTKQNWSWAYAGVKMLECMGIYDVQASDIARAALHNPLSDKTESISYTLNAVRSLLPEDHCMKKSNLLSLIGIFNGKGLLQKTEHISDLYVKGLNICSGLCIKSYGEPTLFVGFKPFMLTTSTFIDCDEENFIFCSLGRGIPVMTSFYNKNVVLITGIELDANRIRYWDVNRGEVEENFVGEFTSKRESYADLSLGLL